MACTIPAYDLGAPVTAMTHGPRKFGMNPEYISRMAKIERAATREERERLCLRPVRPPQADLAERRRNTFVCATFEWLGSTVLDPLSFALLCPLSQCQWFGLIMPRQL